MFSAIATKVLGLMTLLVFSSSVVAVSTVHHDLKIILNPLQGSIDVQDKITLPVQASSFEFELHADLAVKHSDAFDLKLVGNVPGSVPKKRYRLNLNSAQRSVALHYAGVPGHRFENASSDYSSREVWTPAVISEDGVFLGGVSGWYPRIGDYALSFDMQVSMPEDWVVVSQGKPVASKINSWQEQLPQEEIYLIAARYHRYEARGESGVLAQVYLRDPDSSLAERYLAFTDEYINLYSRLIGEYPYHKFALVENFLQTGYGMPSFTLLGSKVIRLPFIPYTSYPHEVLHNWWGNSVYVDYASGNWSEGLTTYLADHLLKQQRDGGSDYRRDALQRYADYVSTEKDIALSQFRARHSKASQAIGYSKAMMLFHMVRLAIGDQQFVEGLRKFYQQNRFTVAGYEQLLQAFEQSTDVQLRPMFEQWLARTGLPSLEVARVDVKRMQDGYELELELKQKQNGDAFTLMVPVYIQTDAGRQPLQKLVQMDGKQQLYRFRTSNRPVRIAIDPQYDTLRRLHPDEVPASLAQVFAADNTLIVLPSAERADLRSAYAALADSWSRSGGEIEVVMDDTINDLPQGRMVWIFGRSNRFAKSLLAELSDGQFIVNPESLNVSGHDYAMKSHSFAVTARQQDNNVPVSRTVGWLVAHSVASLPGLARKLPHYGKYSYVIFEGQEPTNVLKAQWQQSDSDLWVNLPGGESSQAMLLPPQQALSDTVNR